MNKWQCCLRGGGEIFLHRLLNPKTNITGLPVIIAHGTLSNSDSVRDLAIYLSDLGFDCWLLEWGGHGHSTPSSNKQDFEFPAFNDAPLAIDTVLEKTGHKRLYWISHSGGGHLPLMYLARNPEQQGKIAGIATLGTQATDAAPDLNYKFRAAYLWLLSMLFNQVSLKALPIKMAEGEPTRLLAQWAKWNLRKQWLGNDGFDYMKGIEQLNLPFFMIAGGNDDIAPVSGCKRIYDHIGSDDKAWLECSLKKGFSRNFTHGQLVKGRAAREEIYPKIGEWLAARNK